MKTYAAVVCAFECFEKLFSSKENLTARAWRPTAEEGGGEGNRGSENLQSLRAGDGSQARSLQLSNTGGVG